MKQAEAPGFEPLTLKQVEFIQQLGDTLNELEGEYEWQVRADSQIPRIKLVFARGEKIKAKVMGDLGYQKRRSEARLNASRAFEDIFDSIFNNKLWRAAFLLSLVHAHLGPDPIRICQKIMEDDIRQRQKR